MNWSILHKYLSEECNPEEVQQVENWLDADEHNREFMDSLKKIWNIEPADEIEVDAKSAWNSFHQKMDDKQQIPKKKDSFNKRVKHQRRSNNRRKFNRALAVALSAAAVILVAFLFTQYVPVNNEEGQVQSEFAMQEIMTSKGQQTTFRLSDGTFVKLNADSRMKIPEDFMQTTRKVILEGEAYFEVTYNPDKPFVVQTNKAHTRVLGTKFGVRAYPEEDRTQVVVTEGKVALGKRAQALDSSDKIITRNQIGFLSGNGRAEVSDVANIQRYLGWKDGELVFEDTPLRQVRSQLDRWFNISCTVADSSLDNRRITATFKGEPMNEVLVVIALSMDISYERDGRNITFKKN